MPDRPLDLQADSQPESLSYYRPRVSHHPGGRVRSDDVVAEIMKLVFETSSSNPDFNGDVDYLYLDITSEDARKALETCELVKQLRRKQRDLHALTLWGIGFQSEWFAFSPPVPTTFDRDDPFGDQVVNDNLARVVDGVFVMKDDFVPPSVLIQAAADISADFTAFTYLGTGNGPDSLGDVELRITGNLKNCEVSVETFGLTENLLKEIANAAV